MSSFRSFEILLHRHPVFDVVRRGLLARLLALERDALLWLLDEDFELVVLDLDLVLLEIGLRAKR